MTLKDEFVTFLVVPLCAGIGIVLAMIFELMVDNGWLIDEFISGSATLADLQMVTVAIFILIGILAGVMRRR